MEYGGIYEKKMLIIGGQYSYIIDIYSVFCLLIFMYIWLQLFDKILRSTFVYNF